MIGKVSKNVGEPGLRVDVIQLAGFDQRVDSGGPMASGIRTRECPVGAA